MQTACACSPRRLFPFAWCVAQLGVRELSRLLCTAKVFGTAEVALRLPCSPRHLHADALTRAKAEAAQLSVSASGESTCTLSSRPRLAGAVGVLPGAIGCSAAADTSGSSGKNDLRLDPLSALRSARSQRPVGAFDGTPQEPASVRRRADAPGVDEPYVLAQHGVSIIEAALRMCTPAGHLPPVGVPCPPDFSSWTQRLLWDEARRSYLTRAATYKQRLALGESHVLVLGDDGGTARPVPPLSLCAACGAPSPALRRAAGRALPRCRPAFRCGCCFARLAGFFNTLQRASPATPCASSRCLSHRVPAALRPPRRPTRPSRLFAFH